LRDNQDFRSLERVEEGGSSQRGERPDDGRGLVRGLPAGDWGFRKSFGSGRANEGGGTHNLNIETVDHKRKKEAEKGIHWGNGSKRAFEATEGEGVVFSNDVTISRTHRRVIGKKIVGASGSLETGREEITMGPENNSGREYLGEEERRLEEKECHRGLTQQKKD